MDKHAYDNFLLRLINNEELEFKYKGITYAVVHDPPYVYIFRNVIFANKKYTTESYERYSSIYQLLDSFKIDGKKIEDIWYKITVCDQHE